MGDTRETILVQLQACLKALRPGVVFSFPFGKTHRPIVTDLRGHVFARVIPQARFDAEDLPCVELITSEGTEDAVREVADDDFYMADLNVTLWGYARSGDAGTDHDAPVRRVLNALRADLIVAVEAFPYWTSAEYPEPIIRQVGLVTPVLLSSWTEPASDSADGFLTIDYALRYTFNKLDP